MVGGFSTVAGAAVVAALTIIITVVNGNSEGHALYALRRSLTDPDNVLVSWDPNLVNPCTWFHVTCNQHNHVTRLDLGSSNLSGHLVPDLGKLEHLQYLEVYKNNIQGTIPTELGNLKSLISLDLYNNNISGTIPPSLGKLKSLVFLDVSGNNLCGTIPTMDPQPPRVTTMHSSLIFITPPPINSPLHISFFLSKILSFQNSLAASMADRSPPRQQIQVQPPQYSRDAAGEYRSSKTGPSASQILAVVALLPVGGILLALAGIIFVGSMIGLVVATPLFVICSPVIVPAIATIGFAVTGFLSSGAFGLTGLSSLSWLLNYFKQANESMPEQMEQAKKQAL